MVEFLSSDIGRVAQMALLLFFWVPFAVSAYLVELWDHEATRRRFRDLSQRMRHAGAARPTIPRTA